MEQPREGESLSTSLNPCTNNDDETLREADVSSCPSSASTTSQKLSHASPPSDGKQRLRRLLNRNMKIAMTDGRTLIGMFLCTDRSCNVILGSCQEYLNYELVEAQHKRQRQLLQQKSDSPDSSSEGSEDSTTDLGPVEEPRVLGLAMVPGHHIVSIHVDDPIPDSGEEDEGGAIL